MLHTPLCDLLNIQYPIIQAGMGWDKEGLTTPPALVAAVSNAGGLGCIGGSSIRPEVIRERIRAVRQLTDKPFGVDITLPKMEDVKIPDPDEVHKEIQEKFPKHARSEEHTSELQSHVNLVCRLLLEKKKKKNKKKKTVKKKKKKKKKRNNIKATMKSMRRRKYKMSKNRTQ